MNTPAMIKPLSAALALFLLSAACGPAPAVNVAQSTRPRLIAPGAPPNDLRSLVEGNNAFALALYQSLRSDDGNLIFSPFSISLALAMTYAGARGETEAQMAEALRFTMPQDRLHPAFNLLDLDLAKRGEAISKDEEPLQLNIANAVWAQQGHPFLQEYLDLMAMNYGAGIRLADFANQAEAVRREINDWVSERTEGKIEDLLPEGVLDALTRMVLVNAIYFKADWETQFDPDNTAEAPFYLLDGSQVQVEMMSNGFYGMPYSRGDGYQAVELAYQGGTAAMDIIVPDEGRFSEFEAALDADALSTILNEMQPVSVDLSLPKFRFTSEFSLPEQLAALGMTDAFDPNRADFSGMDGARDLYISDVIHKAFVAVDEEGTEAAAATAVIIRETSAPLYDVTLTVDRPFIFVIRDLPSGQILFIGRVLNPAQ